LNHWKGNTEARPLVQSSETREALDDKGRCPAWRLARSGRPPRSDCALPTIATTPDHHSRSPLYHSAPVCCRRWSLPLPFPNTYLCAAHLVGPQGSEASKTAYLPARSKRTREHDTSAGYLRCVAAIGTVQRCHTTAAQLDCEESSLAQNWHPDLRPSPACLVRLSPASSFCPGINIVTHNCTPHAACAWVRTVRHTVTLIRPGEPCSVLPAHLTGPPCRAPSRSSHRVPCPSLSGPVELASMIVRSGRTGPTLGGWGTAAAHSMVVVATGSPGVLAQGDQTARQHQH
jgi:hypothetical protein